MDITLLKWHPYSNRQLDVRSTIEDYTSEASDSITFRGINFNKADGVDTVQIVNYPIGTDDKEFDYLIVSEPRRPRSENENYEVDIVSRWYIIESRWNRQSQRILTLHRDLLADYWSTIKSDDFYCEKGIVPSNDTFIFTPEDTQFNQILKSSTDIKASGAKSYIVGMVSTNTPAVVIPPTPAITVSKLDEWEYYDALVASGTKSLITDPSTFILSTWWGASQTVDPVSGMFERCYGINIDEYGSAASGHTSSSTYTKPYVRRYINATNLATVSSTIHDVLLKPTIKTQALRDYHVVNSVSISALNNQYLFDKSTGDTYQIHVSVTNPTTHLMDLSKIDPGILDDQYNEIHYKINSVPGWDSGFTMTSGSPINENDYQGQGRISAIFSFVTINVTLYSQVGQVFPAQTSSNSQAQPYNLFYCENTDANLKKWAWMSKYLSSGGYLYDMQIIPYMDTTETTTGTSFTLNGIEHYYMKSNTFKKTVSISNPSYIASMTNKDKKNSNIQTMMRMCAPDHSSAFEFNGRKGEFNSSTISFQVKVSIKPFSTQIWIKPSWSETSLYGIVDAHDARGLIYNGSLSLPMVTDQWLAYQANNASYADAFNRQIEHMEFNNKYEKAGEIAHAILGGASAGIQTGAYTGSALGGLAAGLTTLGAGLIDSSINDKLRGEALDYAKDQFALTNASVQARTNTLTTSGSLSCLNNIFPVLEYYDCTDKEKTAWNQFVKYNAWALNKIITLNEAKTNATTYSSISKFIKGSLCRCSLNEDNHTLNALQNELQRGVYIENV